MHAQLELPVAARERGHDVPPGMVPLPGGTFRMGSDKHYSEEAPVHRVTVDAFWIDRTPVTNRQFKEFVRATGYVTFAEIPPDPKDYPGALAHMLYAGSLVFSPPQQAVDLRDWSQWRQFMQGADWRHAGQWPSHLDIQSDVEIDHRLRKRAGRNVINPGFGNGGNAPFRLPSSAAAMRPAIASEARRSGSLSRWA